MLDNRYRPPQRQQPESAQTNGQSDAVQHLLHALSMDHNVMQTSHPNPPPHPSASTHETEPHRASLEDASSLLLEVEMLLRPSHHTHSTNTVSPTHPHPNADSTEPPVDGRETDAVPFAMETFWRQRLRHTSSVFPSAQSPSFANADSPSSPAPPKTTAAVRSAVETGEPSWTARSAAPDAFTAQWWRFRETAEGTGLVRRRREGEETAPTPSVSGPRRTRAVQAEQSFGETHDGEFYPRPDRTRIRPDTREALMEPQEGHLAAIPPTSHASMQNDEPLLVSVETTPIRAMTALPEVERDLLDSILCYKEARRYRRNVLITGEEVEGSFVERIHAVREMHEDTIKRLEDAESLMQQERKWITMRCTVLYDRLKQIGQRRVTLMECLKKAYNGQLPPELVVDGK